MKLPWMQCESGTCKPAMGIPCWSARPWIDTGTHMQSDMGRMLGHQRGYPTLTVEHMQGLLELCWRQPSIRRFYMTALAFGAGAHSDGGKSSRTSGWSICAKTGCACLFRMIFIISSMKASGLSTKACAILDETRFALLHFVQDSHSLVFAHIPFPFFGRPLG